MSNRYLKKVAAWAGLAKGFSGLGKGFKAVDSAYGSLVRTVQKASKPITPSPFSYRDSIKNARNAMVKDRGNNRLLTKSEVRQTNRDVLSKFRTEQGMVKNKPIITTTTGPNGTSSKYTHSGYQKGTATGDNRFIGHIQNKIKANSIDADRIRAARAKLAIGATGLAGASALGYHAANRNSDPGFNQQSYQYMP